jgi:hypothetical protein
MFEYWRAVARRVHAHFTFFVSGVYLVDWAHHDRYSPPRHARGRSDIGCSCVGGLRPSGVAPEQSLTRFTWSLGELQR